MKKLKKSKLKGKIIGENKIHTLIDYANFLGKVDFKPNFDDSDIEFVEKLFEEKYKRKPLRFTLDEIDELYKNLKKGVNFVPVICIVKNPDNWLPDEDYEYIEVIEYFECERM